MIESEKKRIRKEFQPLTIAVSLKIMTPNSLANQVYNPVANEYDPDRGVTPLVILPEVIANAADGSWDMPYVNSLLAEMNWFANGENISAISSWNGKYSIDTVGDTRGAITISRNVAPGESFELHFEGLIADTRLGVNIPVKTDSIMLTTVDKSEDTYGLSIGDSQIIQYNPFLDKLLLYDYKVANNLISASTANRNAALDENSYERTIPLMVTKGVNKITTGYTIELYQVNSISSQTMLTTANHEIVALSLTSLTMDLRLVEKGDYLLLAKVGGKEVARQQFSINRVYPKFTCIPASQASINPDEILHRNVAMVQWNGEIVPIPAPIIRMVWFTDSANKTGVQWQEGEKTVIMLDGTGIGETYLDDWLDVYIKAEQKKAFSVLTDGTNEYTDSNGNIYINN